MGLQEDQRKAPNLRIHSRSSPSLDLELAGFGIITIAVDSPEEKLNFVRFQETPSRLFCDLLGEVDHEDVAEQTDADCQDAFDDEDPSPAAVACYASLLDLESVVVLSLQSSKDLPFAGGRTQARRRVRYIECR